LDLREDFDSINTARHSRITRPTPSASLCSYVRLKWGPLQNPPPCCPEKQCTAVGGTVRISRNGSRARTSIQLASESQAPCLSIGR
jgi:hypothetical protein